MKTNYSDIMAHATEALYNHYGRKTISDETIEVVAKSVIADVDQSKEIGDAQRVYRQDAYRLAALRLLCGDAQNGTWTTVKIFEDDATNDWFCVVDNMSFIGRSFNGAIDAAIQAMQARCLHPDTKGDPDSIHLHLCLDCGAVV